jgi:hypothetical protein
MRKVLGVLLAAAMVVTLAGAAFAYMGGYGMGPGAMGQGRMFGPGGYGHGRMMGGPGMWGAAGCPGLTAEGVTATAITEERATEIAKEYVEETLPGYTVEKVTPFPVRRGTLTAFNVELKGPKGEKSFLHINPFGAVMGPGAWQRPF